MERDDPTWNRGAFSDREDILSVNDSSDIEMMSVVDVPAHPSGDSTLVTGFEDEGETPANNPGFSGHPDSNPEYDSGNEESPPGSDSGPVRTRPAVTMMMNSATCSALEGPFNLSKGSPSPEHSPIAAAGHENQNHTSEL